MSSRVASVIRLESWLNFTTAKFLLHSILPKEGKIKGWGKAFLLPFSVY